MHPLTSSTSHQPETSAEDIGLRYIDQRNRMLEERSRLFVARHRETGQYGTRFARFLHGCKDWREYPKPTVAEVREQVAEFLRHAPAWTADINEAEPWDRYDIESFRDFLPDIEFIPVQLSVV